MALVEDAPDGVLDLNKAAEALNVRCAALKLYKSETLHPPAYPSFLHLSLIIPTVSLAGPMVPSSGSGSATQDVQGC